MKRENFEVILQQQDLSKSISDILKLGKEYGDINVIICDMDYHIGLGTEQKALVLLVTEVKLLYVTWYDFTWYASKDDGNPLALLKRRYSVRSISKLCHYKEWHVLTTAASKFCRENPSVQVEIDLKKIVQTALDYCEEELDIEAINQEVAARKKEKKEIDHEIYIGPGKGTSHYVAKRQTSHS